MAKHSTGNLIFLLVFALLCGDWAEPAKATAAVGGHKALSKLLPDSSKISTKTILLAQARGKGNNGNGNNGNGQGGGTCNNDKNNQNQSGQDCDDLKSGVSGATEKPNTKLISNIDQWVDVYELPIKYKTILPSSDNKFYGVDYLMWSDPSESAGSKPGLSNPKYSNEKNTEKFFPWKGNESLAKELSDLYHAFAKESLGNDLNEEGNIVLHGFDNGGGFVYGGFDGDQPIGENRPFNEGDNRGLLYYYNNNPYYTSGGAGGVGRIQAFGGCEVNTISQGKKASTSKILSEDLCRLDDDNDQFSSDYYVPLLDGGELSADASESSDIELSNQFFVTDKGGTVNNNNNGNHTKNYDGHNKNNDDSIDDDTQCNGATRKYPQDSACSASE